MCIYQHFRETAVFSSEQSSNTVGHVLNLHCCENFKSHPDSLLFILPITRLTAHMKNGHIRYTVKPIYTVPLCIILLPVSYIVSVRYESPT